MRQGERPGLVGGPRAGQAGEEPAADAGELGGVASADQGREVPAGKFLPNVAVGVEREEIQGGVELCFDVAAD